MNTGFILRELRVSGPGREDAVLTFKDGLNVVAGPSESGKTYVAQCLSFMLGSGTPPKDIPQAAGYVTAQLRLRGRADDTEHVLVRRLDGTGDVVHQRAGLKPETLRPGHDAKRQDTLPALLLSLSGLSAVVRTNAAGVTRPLAFSDIARLFFVDEETVIGERSPILTGQYTSRTVERRVFRFLLTGADDAGVVALEKPAMARSRRAGRTEVLEELQRQARAELGRLDVTGEAADAERRVAEWAARAEVAVAALERARQTAAPVEERRRVVLADLRHTRSRSDHRRELQTRFALLDAQYELDLERLALVAQAGGRLDQLAEERCPVCGAAAEHQQHEHRDDHIAAAEIAVSCQAEADKIRVLLRDLRATIGANDAELQRLEAEVGVQDLQLFAVDRELSDALLPRVAAASQELREAETAHRRELLALAALRRVEELDQRLTTVKANSIPKRAEGSTEGPTSAEVDALASCAERMLKAWHFPDVDRVSWSEGDEDLVVSGRARSSYGKGKRAIVRTAFNLGLLRVLLDEGRPSPGLVIVDSPLVVYREPDADEKAFPPAVKQHFYEAVTRDFADAQVIILENEQPPRTIEFSARVETFTGTAAGRRGFFP